LRRGRQITRLRVMFVTALVELPPFGPDAARRLSVASGLPLRLAGDRLQVPRRGPAVVGCFDDAAAAHRQLDALTEAGFQGFVLAPPWPPVVQVRQLVVVGNELMVALEGGQRQIIAGHELPLVVWGTRILPVGTVVAERTAGDTPSGLRHRRLPVEVREGFLRLFLEGGRTLRVDSSVVAGLDDHAFDLLVRAVRRVCPTAFDDRLVAQRTQVQMLGHLLTPESHMDLAILLVARARGWDFG